MANAHGAVGPYADPLIHADDTNVRPAAPPAAGASAILPAGTLVMVTLDQDISSHTHAKGDLFSVTVDQDVVSDGTIVIPKGTHGEGIVTFATKKGSFGKGGILQIALRSLTIDGRTVALDGRFREEGKDNSGATSAAFFAVGIFSAAIQGKTALIPKGRALKAHTGGDLAFTPGAPAATPPPTAQ